MKHEFDILRWLDNRFNVPKAIYYDFNEFGEYLLTSEIPGTPVYKIPCDKRSVAMVTLGKALREIHSLDIKNCPYSNTISDLLAKVEVSGFIDKFEKTKPEEQLVFTHGDYCLPNVLIFEHRLGGVIDWDHAGIGDPYIDIVQCIKSIKYNFGDDADSIWLPIFLRNYGIKKINDGKFRYYQSLLNIID